MQKSAKTAQNSLTSITEASVKRQRTREKLTNLLFDNLNLSISCRNVSGPGLGGSDPNQCIENYRQWVQKADTFIQTLDIADNAIFATTEATSHAVAIDSTAPQEIRGYIVNLDAKANAIHKLIKSYRN